MRFFGAAHFASVGCTATAVYMYLEPSTGNRYIQVANVGDSSAFLCRNGVAIPVSVDHSAAHPSEKERLRRDFGVEIEAGCKRLPGVELAVSRALGDFFAKAAEVKSGLIATPYVHPTIQVEEHDSFLVFASDGLWDIFTGQQVVDMVLNLMRIKEIEKGESGETNMAQFLINKAMEAEHCHDNISAIVIVL
jgi:serine/threonine protein phosphatase PrpC